MDDDSNIGLLLVRQQQELRQLADELVAYLQDMVERDGTTERTMGLDLDGIADISDEERIAEWERELAESADLDYGEDIHAMVRMLRQFRARIVELEKIAFTLQAKRIEALDAECDEFLAENGRLRERLGKVDDAACLMMEALYRNHEWDTLQGETQDAMVRLKAAIDGESK